MQHKQLIATTTETDTEQGTFSALVSAWDSDREQDTIARDAFNKTIEAWQQSGKNLPLLYQHTTAVVGAVDPFSMHPSVSGLVVAGEVDRSVPEGQQVWRSIKANTAGFSIGFAAESRPRKGGGRELIEIDLLEISWTPTPTNASTRALSWKHAQTRVPIPTDAELKQRAEALGIRPSRLTVKELKALSQEVVLEAASGLSATEQRQLAKASTQEREQNKREQRELRRRADHARLEIATGFSVKSSTAEPDTDLGTSGAADTECTESDRIRKAARDQMLAILLAEGSQSRGGHRTHREHR
jgi:HK97 family phage prohead protease